MKKSLLGLLLAVALVVPAFASDETNLELIPKIGYIFSPEGTFDYPGNKKTLSKDSAFSAGAELFFDLENNLFLGLGIMWGDNHQYCDNDRYKIGFTNIYATLKYKFLANGSENDPLFIYPLINLGGGAPGWSYEGTASNYEIQGGFYWAAGIGGEYKNIILELVYGCNYAKEKYTVFNGYDFVDQSVDFSYTAFRINIGYKFSL